MLPLFARVLNSAIQKIRDEFGIGMLRSSAIQACPLAVNHSAHVDCRACLERGLMRSR
jgi:hypothetical protein